MNTAMQPKTEANKTFNYSVLIAVPDLEMPGGVANYYKAVRSYLPDSIVYFSIGKKVGERGIIKAFLRLRRDYILFKRLLKSTHFNVVVVNPSLNKKALFRDKFYVNYAKRKGINVITFFRGWSTEFAANLNRQNILISSFLQSDAIITLSKSSERTIKNLGFEGTTYVETTTVENQLLKNAHPKTFDAKREITILVLCRIEVSKGIYEAIDTFYLLKAKHPYIRMLIAGTGSELEKLKQYVSVKKIEDVVFLGYVKGQEKIKAYSESDIYFFPSFHDEGMPNSVLEALGFGLPIVTRTVGGVQDFFENDKMGYSTESKEPEVFADLISRLISNPQQMQDISEYNYNFAGMFLSSVVSDRLKKIFTEVANNLALI